MVIDPPIYLRLTDKERLELFTINGSGTPKTSIFGLRLLKKLKEEQPMTSEELSAMWKELRPQIGHFMCCLDNEVKFIEVHHDEYVAKEEHQQECDESYDAGIEVGRNSRESDYKWCINRLYDLEESELFELFGEDCPMDVLRIFSIDHILGILTDYFDKQKQIEKEAARDAAKHAIDEWRTRTLVRLVDEYKHKSHVLCEEYTKKLRDIGLDEDGQPLKEDQDE